MTAGWMVAAAAMLLGFVLVAVFLVRGLRAEGRRQEESLQRRIREEMQFAQQQLLQTARQELALEQNRASAELESRRRAVEETVRGLRDQLEQYQRLIREFERERERKYGNLESELRNASQATLRLQETTGRLNEILGNVRLRGQWGERMAEDIIRYAGLVEGVNYHRQKSLASSGTKPDYTFLLPDEHVVNMDVKFPLNNYLRMVNAEDDAGREAYARDFQRDVRDRIREIQTREYINPREKTLDFVLLFIPNEQVFSLIHERMPDVMDLALRQKVVLCSPFTLYAMLCVIRQAYENFRYEKDLKKIIRQIEQFVTIYDRFKGRFEGLGATLAKAIGQYEDLRDKSFKQLETKMRHIDGYKKGRPLLETDPETIDTTALAIEEAE